MTPSECGTLRAPTMAPVTARLPSVQAAVIAPPEVEIENASPVEMPTLVSTAGRTRIATGLALFARLVRERRSLHSVETLACAAQARAVYRNSNYRNFPHSALWQLRRSSDWSILRSLPRCKHDGRGCHGDVRPALAGSTTVLAAVGVDRVFRFSELLLDDAGSTQRAMWPLSILNRCCIEREGF